MPRDTNGPAVPIEPIAGEADNAGLAPVAAGAGADASGDGRSKSGLGLSAKLLLYTLAFVMLAEVLIFVPSVANFRRGWLNDRLTAAQLASLAAEAVPGGRVPDSLRKELLRTAQVKSVALKRNDQRRLVLVADMPSVIYAHVDLREQQGAGGASAAVTSWARMIWDAMRVFAAPPGAMQRVIGQPGMGAGDFIEIVLPVAPLKKAMIRYGLNVLALSIIISIITAALVYVTLNNLLIRPMTRISSNMLRFSKHPEDASRIIEPSNRRDEIGTTERELANMQRELAQALHQKTRLAALGLAVSKINHDLRNMLASAQLISDRLGSLPDPSVQRFAPKLIASLDRAITFCNHSLKFGQAEEASPRRDLLPLKPLVDEVGDSLGLPRPGQLAWKVEINPQLHVDADREQLYRVLSNLCRNAVQAIDSQAMTGSGEIMVKAGRAGRLVTIEISDNGPGIPQRAREKLFKAFQGSTRKGGSGLGLTIAQELVGAHGGRITLLDGAGGTTFRLDLPDRMA